MKPKRLVIEVATGLALAIQTVRLTEEALRIIKARKSKPTYGFSRELDKDDGLIKRLRRKLDY